MPITVGNTSGVAASTVNIVRDIAADALAFWGQYIAVDIFSIIDIELNIISLGNRAAEASVEEFVSVGGNVFEAGTISEIKTGIDPNGAAKDVTINVDLGFLTDGTLSIDGSIGANELDLFTLLLHEVGHGLGFTGFDSGSANITTFQQFITGSPGNLAFAGANVVAAFGGQIPVEDDEAHLRQSLSDILSPLISTGERIFLSDWHLAILEDLGVPIIRPTNGTDIITGFINDITYDLLGGSDFFQGLSANDFVNGGSGNDTLNGGQGFDTLNGGDGSDLLNGGLGKNDLEGGNGIDFVSYQDANAAIVNLSDFSFTKSNGTVVNARSAEVDILIQNLFRLDFLSNIENVIGSPFDDIIIGDTGVNYLIGGDGNDLIRSGGLFVSGEFDTLEGGAGNDTLLGYEATVSVGFGAENFIPGAGDDFVDGSNGIDFIDYRNAPGAVSVSLMQGTAADGTGGTDTLINIENVLGSQFDDTIIGSGADDALFGEGGDDTIAGLGGDDQLVGGAGNDALAGMDGADSLFAGPGNDELQGNDGNDFLSGGDGNDQLTGGLGADSLFGDASNDGLSGNEGADSLDGGSGFDTLLGGSGDDVLGGGDGNDRLNGGNDNDTLDGGRGNDRLSGDAGNDSIMGGLGFDTIRGASGNDTINGDGGNDKIFGGVGVDLIDGGLGADRIRSEGGNDTVDGGAGDDRIFGSFGFDLLNGGGDNDLLDGNGGNDTLNGDDGIDTLIGNFGFDSLNGGAGDDRIQGSTGNDRLTGGLGNDTFVFALGDGNDRISDFVSGAGTDDVIELSGFGASFDTFAEVIAAASQIGNKTVIDFGGGDTITLQGVVVADLHQDDFVFG